MDKRKLLLLSASNVHGYDYMQYAAKDIQNFLNKNEVLRVLFIPYAQLNCQDYFEKVAPVFRSLGFSIDSIHRFDNEINAIREAESIFIGGGNTFLLLKALYDKSLIGPIREQVLKYGVPYMGSSAGTNVATCNIATTNDMPIVHPRSYDGLNLIPFNINPHFSTGHPKDMHMGETRMERILQYLELPHANPVLGMCEGCMLHVEEDRAMISGIKGGVLFEPGLKPKELKIGSDVSYLLKPRVFVCPDKTC